MKANESNSSEAIWGYVHGELDIGARNALEQEMARDADLHSRYESARQLDGMLRATLPALGTDEASDEAIAGQVLAAWEREQAAAVQATRAARPFVKGSVFLRRAGVGVAGLAAAAALVLVVSPALRAPGGARWAEPVFTPLTFRGGGRSSEPAAVTPAVAALCQAALRAALDKAIEAHQTKVPSTTLSFRLQVLRHGAFSVAVTARQHGGQVVGEWGGDYSGVQAFLSQADASAVRIAETLAASSEQVEGQP
ncbi:MAG: hypothetical protein WCK89_02750 [bacterium]